MAKEEVLEQRGKVHSVANFKGVNGGLFADISFKINGVCVPVFLQANKLKFKQKPYAGERLKVFYKEVDNKIKVLGFERNNGIQYSKVKL